MPKGEHLQQYEKFKIIWNQSTILILGKIEIRVYQRWSWMRELEVQGLKALCFPNFEFFYLLKHRP